MQMTAEPKTAPQRVGIGAVEAGLESENRKHSYV